MRIVGSALQCALGAGRLWGTVKTAASPDLPVKRRVHVVEAVVDRLITVPAAGLGISTISGEQGEWVARGLDPAKKYHAIAYDHTGQYDPVIKMNLVPTVD